MTTVPKKSESLFVIAFQVTVWPARVLKPPVCQLNSSFPSPIGFKLDFKICLPSRNLKRVSETLELEGFNDLHGRRLWLLRPERTCLLAQQILTRSRWRRIRPTNTHSNQIFWSPQFVYLPRWRACCKKQRNKKRERQKQKVHFNCEVAAGVTNKEVVTVVASLVLSIYMKVKQQGPYETNGYDWRRRWPTVAGCKSVTRLADVKDECIGKKRSK